MFTERQERIIHGEPVEGLRKREITTVLRKLNKMGFDMLEVEVYDRYEGRFFPTSHKPKYTIEEAERILQELTPWERATPGLKPKPAK